jgi:hypothetical protein
MPTWIAPLRRAPLLACLVFAAGCQDQPPGEPASHGTGAEADPNTLFGAWRWVESERGAQIVQPGGPSDRMTFELRPLGLYRESVGGSPLSGHYSLGEGRLHQTQDSAFTVLLLDSSRFFPSSGDLGPAIAVRWIQGDSLLLSGTGTDSTFYTFVRVERP